MIVTLQGQQAGLTEGTVVMIAGHIHRREHRPEGRQVPVKFV